ncbi:response regulator [Silvanigrella paludirubra]|uniref:Response regulator n=1 Tax=Silvanigrella paludirubra TaxID=2499159 RepID=A0A6N6VTJ6_9BACT|nr:response regulator [Silvanigrella paludirubra]KAB8036769.1 response regulator [Silvanigrella paludirubra]
MTNTVTDKEILLAFIKNATQKVQELNGVATVLLKEGARPELFDAIARSTSAIKSFASTCHQNHISDFITSKLDSEFDHIRLQNLSITEEIKKNVKENITVLKDLIKNVLKEESPQETEVSKEDDDTFHSLLTSIGQLSVWSFHELMNALAKVHGYTEMLEDINQQIPDTTPQLKSDLKTIQEKLIYNTSHMTGIINRIRSLRGKTKINIKEHNIRDVIKNIQDLTQQPPKSLNWSSLHIPSVNVQFDQIIFEQIWVHLWKLLGEWQIPGTLVQSMCFGKIDLNKSTNNPKFKNNLTIYIWLEPNGTVKFDPTTLQYSTQTPQPDLAYVFHYTSKIAKRISAEVNCAKTAYNGVIFSITIPCGDINLSVSESTGNQIPQPLHILKMKQQDKAVKNVLILDDEKDLRTILSLKINKMGYAVSVAENIAEANKILDSKHIDLIISDLFLGQESGLDLLKTLSINAPKIPFIFITGASEDDISKPILDILAKYSKAFLTKPIATQLLKETLDKIIPL